MQPLTARQRVLLGAAALCVLSGAIALVVPRLQQVMLEAALFERHCKLSSCNAAQARELSWLSLKQLSPFVAQQTSLQQKRSNRCPWAGCHAQPGAGTACPLRTRAAMRRTRVSKMPLRKVRLGRCLGLSLTALGHGAGRGRQHGCLKMGRRHRRSHQALQGSPHLSPCGQRTTLGTMWRWSSNQGLSPCSLRGLARQGLPLERPADTSLRGTHLATHCIDCLTRRYHAFCLTCRPKVMHAERQGSGFAEQSQHQSGEFREQSPHQTSRGPDVPPHWQPCSECGSDCSHCSTGGAAGPSIGLPPITRARLRTSSRPPPEGLLPVQQTMPPPGATSRAPCSPNPFLATAC